MIKNLELTGGLVFSQRILLELPKYNISRENAYKIVQRNAMKVWKDLQNGKKTINQNGDSLYLEYLLKDSELTNILDENLIRKCFNYDYYLKNIDNIFKRVFNNCV